MEIILPVDFFSNTVHQDLPSLQGKFARSKMLETAMNCDVPPTS